MAEIGAAAAILQVAHMASQTALKVYESFSIIRNAPREIKSMNHDIHNFYTLVNNLETSLRSTAISNIVDGDPELNKVFWTLEAPIRNCCETVKNVREKIKPHLKANSVAEGPVDSEDGRRGSAAVPVQRAWISRTDFLWLFKRREVFALASQLERTRSTFRDAMGSVTLVLTLRMKDTMSVNGTARKDFEYEDDLGSVLNDYAVSRLALSDHSDTESTAVASRRGSIISTTTTETQTPPLQTGPEAARELKAAVTHAAPFFLKSMLQHFHVDARDPRGRTALSHAAEMGNIEIVKTLLEHGASVSARQWSITGFSDGVNPYHISGASPLYYATRSRHLEIVKLLLQHGANPHVRTTSGSTPIAMASEHGAVEIVKLLLTKNVDVNTRNYKDGWSPLVGATCKEHMETIKLLLDHGAIPDLPLTYPDSKAPLHFAVTNKRPKALKILLEYGADPNGLMLEDVTPLHLAAAGGWIPGIETLIEHNAFIDARDALLHETPLHKAARNRGTQAIEKLCALGANQNARNVDGQSYQEILECAMAAPGMWKVPEHLAIYIGKDMWWCHD